MVEVKAVNRKPGLDWWEWGLLFLAGLFVAMLGSRMISAPGYMDADYYFVTGKVLAEGGGFSEPFLWNYLDDPQGVPHPSHQYWMPLTSMVAALPMAIWGPSFRAAQFPFLLLAACLPLLASLSALHLGQGRRNAIFAGCLAIVPGYYLPYWFTTDNFILFAVIGSSALMVSSKAVEGQKSGMWLTAGLLAGLGHLTRADGLLLLLVALAAAGILGRRKLVKAILCILLGYALVMGPWFLRQANLAGVATSSASLRVLWTRSYNELFSFPATDLTFSSWWSQGLLTILGDRLQAFLRNLLSLFAVNGLIILGPLAAFGAYEKRDSPLVVLGGLFLAMVMVVMSVVFPFAGMRGGFFHSSSALMPLVWSLAPLGLDAGIRWGERARGWTISHASRLFYASTWLIALAITLFVYSQRVIGADMRAAQWTESQRAYEMLSSWFDEHVNIKDLTAINNPPGFYAASGRSAVVIPDGDLVTLEAVIRRYQVDWLVLDRNNPELAALMDNPSAASWLVLVDELEGGAGEHMMIFQVLGEAGAP